MRRGLFFVAVVAGLFSRSAKAQFTADFQTITISGVTSNWVGQPFYIVGSNTAFDVLQIINSGVLSNSGAIIGDRIEASNNTVIVSGLNSLWTNRFNFYLGNNGAYNRLIVTNRGAVYCVDGYLGFNLFGANNVALISDTGSVWRMKTNLFVGYVDGKNELIVSNGAVVSDIVGMIGSNANLNAATITGPGSMWSNTFSFTHGFIGRVNQLTVTNGGLLWSGISVIGNANISRSNLAAVVGTGSKWVNTNGLFVGDLGYSNRLDIADGGLVNSLSGYIGRGDFSTGNVVRVTGNGAVWSNGVNTYVGYNGFGNQLIVTNGGKVWDQAGAIGFSNTCAGNLVLVEGTGSVWSNTLTCYVGYGGTGNQLIISNGATVFGKTNFIGGSVSASNNTVLVTGSGALWTTTNNLYVGYQGSANTLLVSDAGLVRANETRIGHDPVTSNNMALVTGSGALLSNLNTIVGYGGYGNQLIVSNGATVLDQVGAVGYTNQSSGNSALITGNGSVWSNLTTMYVGYKSAGNQLVIADGGTVFDVDGHVGTFVSASNNAVTVTDNDSLWNSTGRLYIGEQASSNALTVAGGATVAVALESFVGWDDTTSNNAVWVTGPGTLWSNGVNTFVGFAGIGNSLVISSNAVVWDQTGIIGYTNSSVQNLATVAAGGIWSNTVNMQVGYKGSFNELVVTNGGKIYSPDSFIGTFNVGSSNTAIVTGLGSRWATTNTLYVGQDGRSNLLMVADGGGVSAVNGFIGYNATAITNAAVVTGPGATWTNTTLFYIGVFAPGNVLTIRNGGAAYCPGDTVIGYGAASDRNAVLVTGTNSTFVNNRLYLGLDGASNTLTLANGAHGSIIDGYNSDLFVGYNAGSISNTVTVTDPGTYWLLADLFVGYSSRSNSLTIANGGSVECLNSYVGYTTGSNNFALVTGAGSKWQNNQYLYIGSGGSRNSLIISNGGVAYAALGGYVGNGGSGSAISNSVLITDVGSAWTNGGSSIVYVGYTSRGNSLVVSNGGAFHGGYSAVDVGYAATLGDNGSNNVGTVTGAGSLWTADGTLTIGDGSHSNRLTAALAGKVTAINIFVGARGGTNNLLRLTNGLVQASAINVGTGNFLTGAGTVTGNLLNNGTVAANINGATLTFNSIVKNNGALRASGGGIIEFYGPVLNFGTTNFTGGSAIFHAGIFTSTGSTNSWTFAGSDLWETGARWSRTVPPSSADSLVLITNAPTKTVTVTASTFSSAPSSVNNYNIALSAPAGVTNTLRIADTPVGTNFTSVSLTVGTNAVAIVSNATVQVGTFGTGIFAVDGELRVEAGGRLDTTGVLTSRVTTASVNAGSWSNALLSAAVNGRVSVAAGGQLSSSTATLDTNVVVTIDGSNSAWTVAGILIVGNNGPSNQVTITGHGGLTTPGNVYVGGGPSASNNVLTIAGPGATWTNGTDLRIGSGGAGNQVIVTNGARVVNTSFVTIIGDYGGDGNSLTVTGTNSVWSDFGAFVFAIGSNTGSNRLLIADGGSLSNLSGYGCQMGGRPGNTAVVTDPGSVWNTGAGLTLAGQGGNQLLVTNGGVVLGFTSSVGSGAAGSNNLATVTGTNSLWRNIGSLTVGNQANSNRLEIAGGTVVASGLFIGMEGTNNLLRLSGGALFVTNAAGTAPLVVSSSGGPGSLVLNAGSVTADKLIAVNGANSILTFNAGIINTRATFVTNAQQTVIGNAIAPANFHLLGGLHNFNDGLLIRSNAMLSGCGTVNATVVIDPGGAVQADCTPLVFTGSVTNNGTLRAIAGNVLEFYGTVVNNGVLDLITGTTNFHGAFINNGTILTSNDVQIVDISTSGNDINVEAQTFVGHNFQLQQRDSLSAGSWADVPGAQAGTGGILTFPDPGGATNMPTRFYRVRCAP